MANSDFSSYAWGSLYAQGASTFLSGIGSFFLAKNSNAIARIQAQTARLNAQQYMLKAEQTERAAEKQIVSYGLKAGQAKSSQRASLAANGIAVGVGSAAEQTASTDIIREIDTNQLKENALVEAWGYRKKAVTASNAALAYEASKKNAGLRAFSTLASGAAQVGMSYLYFDKNGWLESAKSATDTQNITNTLGRQLVFSPEQGWHESESSVTSLIEGFMPANNILKNSKLGW